MPGNDGYIALEKQPNLVNGGETRQYSAETHGPLKVGETLIVQVRKGWTSPPWKDPEQPMPEDFALTFYDKDQNVVLHWALWLQDWTSDIAFSENYTESIKKALGFLPEESYKLKTAENVELTFKELKALPKDELKKKFPIKMKKEWFTISDSKDFFQTIRNVLRREPVETDIVRVTNEKGEDKEVTFKKFRSGQTSISREDFDKQFPIKIKKSDQDFAMIRDDQCVAFKPGQVGKWGRANEWGRGLGYLDIGPIPKELQRGEPFEVRFVKRGSGHLGHWEIVINGKHDPSYDFPSIVKGKRKYRDGFFGVSGDITRVQYSGQVDKVMMWVVPNPELERLRDCFRRKAFKTVFAGLLNQADVLSHCFLAWQYHEQGHSERAWITLSFIALSGLLSSAVIIKHSAQRIAATKPPSCIDACRRVLMPLLGLLQLHNVVLAIDTLVSAHRSIDMLIGNNTSLEGGSGQGSGSEDPKYRYVIRRPGSEEPETYAAKHSDVFLSLLPISAELMQLEKEMSRSLELNHRLSRLSEKEASRLLELRNTIESIQGYLSYVNALDGGIFGQLFRIACVKHLAEELAEKEEIAQSKAGLTGDKGPEHPSIYGFQIDKSTIEQLTLRWKATDASFEGYLNSGCILPVLHTDYSLKSEFALREGQLKQLLKDGLVRTPNPVEVAIEKARDTIEPLLEYRSVMVSLLTEYEQASNEKRQLDLKVVESLSESAPVGFFTVYVALYEALTRRQHVPIEQVVAIGLSVLSLSWACIEWVKSQDIRKGRFTPTAAYVFLFVNILLDVATRMFSTALFLVVDEFRPLSFQILGFMAACYSYLGFYFGKFEGFANGGFIAIAPVMLSALIGQAGYECFLMSMWSSRFLEVLVTLEIPLLYIWKHDRMTPSLIFLCQIGMCISIAWFFASCSMCFSRRFGMSKEISVDLV